MKEIFRKSLIVLFTLSLISSGCSLRKNNINENNKLTKPEIIENSKIPNKKEVSSRGKVLCFERAQNEENAFLSEIAYEECLLTIDKNLKEYDDKKADLYFLEENEKYKKNKSKTEGKKVIKKKNNKKIKKKNKNKNKNPKVLQTKNKENSCKEGSIAGGAIGAGIGLATAKGKNKIWAIPAGGVAGALIGCQLDGG